MPPVTHYELYVLNHNGWTLQQRFSSSEREEALEEAKETEARTSFATKVVREVYNPDGGESSEVVVYLSPRIKSGRPVGPMVGGPAVVRNGYGFENDGAAEESSAPTAVGIRTADLLGRVLLVLVASLIIAGLSTAVVPSLLDFLATLGLPLGRGRLGHILFGLFLTIFLVCAGVLGRRLIPLASLLRETPAPEPDMPTSRLPPSSGPAAKATAPAAPPTPPPPADPVALMDEAPALDAAEAERTRKRKEKEEREEAERRAKAKKEEEEQRRKEKEAADKAAQKKLAEEGPPLNADQEQARRIAMAFLAGAVASLKGSRIQIDTFTRFGINLYLTGAVGLAGERLGLSSSLLRPVLSEALELMGNRAALVSLFVDKIDEYLLEPRYLQMARHGRDAMAHMLGQNGDPFAELPGIMAEWTTPQTRPSSSSTVAIVFTDMVGSTDHNSRLGDAASRGLNRIHNTLVRSALARFDGREVKNTGDGIMAIFPVVSQAVEAMVEVQRTVADHNAQTPGNPLHIRIGINAGEPVVEEGDYFGLAVTLAARICNQAGPDQILCSGVVRDLSQGKSLYFRNRGDVTLKGIVDPQRIYEIAWADTAAGGTP